MPKVTINDMNMYYEIHGEGIPLVMIMGLSGNVYWWDRSFIDEVSNKFKTIIFDNRGVGRSDDPGVDVSIKMMTDDLIGLMNALNIDRTYLLGISMGGMIAQELVLNYPERT